MPRRAFITGITGQDGQHLAEHLNAQGYEVFGMVLDKKRDDLFRQASDTGKPIVASHPESEVANALREIAELLAAKVSVAALSGKNEVPINIIE